MATRASLLQRAVIRTSRGALEPVWRLAHAAAIRMLASILRFPRRESAVYAKGGFGLGTPVYGLSDIDLVVVADGNAVALRRRWDRLGRLFPLLRRAAPHVWIYEQRELEAAVSATCLTYGLGTAAGPNEAAAYLGRPLVDPMGLLARPGLYGPAREWRLVAGPERRPPDSTDADPERRRIAAWLELAALWRYAYEACVDPTPAYVPYLCVKLVADPVRVWLWLTRGEMVTDRARALERGLVALPEEEQGVRRGLALYRSLPRVREAPLADVLPVFVRLTERIARRLAEDVAGAGTTSVRLLGVEDGDLAVGADWGFRIRKLLLAGADPQLLPLVDWRALAMAPAPDETFTLVAGDPANPATLDVAARAGSVPGAYPALRTNDLLLFPTTSRSLLRTVQCEVTDPVSFAVADGRATARFPNTRGWSVLDAAARSLAEHRAWLASGGAGDGCGGKELGLLFTAARAAFLHASIGAGHPELAMRTSTVAGLVAARSRSHVAEEALAAYRAWRHSATAPAAAVIRAFEREVRALPQLDAKRP